MNIRSKLNGKGCALRGRKTTMKSSLKNKAAYIKAKLRNKFLKPEPPNPRSGVAAIDYIGIGSGLALLVLALLLFLSQGCALQPSRSQTMKICDNTINVFVMPRIPGADISETNALPAGVSGGDVLCQAMMIETGGNEANAQTASTDNALNLPMGDTAVSALGELIGAAITGGVKAAVKEDDPKPATTPTP
jgi:hypothetical protein